MQAVIEDVEVVEKPGNRGYKQKAPSTKGDRGFFLQLPYILIDLLDMNDSAIVGFVRFCRRYLQKDYTATYQGSYRSLADAIKQARMTCYRSVDQWVYAGLVTRTENGDDFTLTVDLSPLWENNSTYCKALQRPKNNHHESPTASQIGTAKALQRPSFTSTMSQNERNSVPNRDTNERKTNHIDSLQDSLQDSGYDRENAVLANASLPSVDVDTEKDSSEEIEHPETRCAPPTPIRANMSDAQQKSENPEVEGSSETHQQNVNDEVKNGQKEKTTRGSRPRKIREVISLSLEEQQVFEWYCQLWFNDVRPEPNETAKKHCKTLVPHILTFENMESLEKIARKEMVRLGIDRRVLYLGNLVKYVNEWKKTIPAPEKPQEQKVIDLTKLVPWTRYTHEGAAIDHWYLYEVMPVSEAMTYGWTQDSMVPNDRLDIKTMLRAWREGRRTLSPDQQAEYDAVACVQASA